MSNILVLNYFAFIGFAITEPAIITAPSNVSTCAGQNVTLRWEYDNPTGLQIATWTFSNDSVNGVTIMDKSGTEEPVAPTPPPLSVQFIENGTITLFDTSSMNTGTYDFTILYSLEPVAISKVGIVINDVPQALTFQEVTTNTFNCSGSSSIPTVIRVTSKDGVSLKTSQYTRSDTRERIECCYNGTAANCSTEEFDYVNGTLYCKLVKEAATVPPTLSTTTQIIQNTTDPWYLWCLCNLTECILAIVIPLLIVIGGCIAIFYCWHKGKCCFDEPRKCPCSSSESTNSGGITSTSHVETSGISSEKSNDVHKGFSGNNSGNETSRETKPPRRTIHDDNQGNGPSIRANGPNALPPMTGYSKVRPDDNQLSGVPDKNTPNNEANYTPRPLPILPNIRSSQAPNLDGVETETPKKKKKKKRKQTKEDQIV